MRVLNYLLACVAVVAEAKTHADDDVHVDDDVTGYSLTESTSGHDDGDLSTVSYAQYDPTVFLHGLNSSCKEIDEYIGFAKKHIGKQGGDPEAQPITCIDIGIANKLDKLGKPLSIFTNLESQTKLICKTLKTDSRFRHKTINLVGISQGGVVARNVVETCELDVNVLFTLGAPHMGTSQVLPCDQSRFKPHYMKTFFCELGNLIFAELAQFPVVQALIGPAAIYKPWYDIAGFYDSHSWLPKINNEFEVDEDRKRRLTSVNHFAMFRWRQDQTVFPSETAWFSEYDINGNITLLRDTDLYKEDWLGLKQLDEAGKLHFFAGNGQHMYMSDYSIKRMLVPLILNNLNRLNSDNYYETYFKF